MKPTEIATAALALRQAAQTREYIAPLRETYPDLTIEAAYAIQRLNTVQKCGDGHRAVGCKIGLTSLAVQKQLGVDQPDFGMLFDDMSYGDSEPIPFETLTQRLRRECVRSRNTGSCCLLGRLPKCGSDGAQPADAGFEYVACVDRGWGLMRPKGPPNLPSAGCRARPSYGQAIRRR
ncbi:2-keto-4-pentenoate hydratase [compost metagenome]